MSPMRLVRHKISIATRRMDITDKVCVQELRISRVRCLGGRAGSRTLAALVSRHSKDFCHFRFEHFWTELSRPERCGCRKPSPEFVVIHNCRYLASSGGQVAPPKAYVFIYYFSWPSAIMNDRDAARSHSLNNRYSEVLVFSTMNIGHSSTKNILYFPQRRENKRNISRRPLSQIFIVGNPLNSSDDNKLNARNHTSQIQ